MHNIETHIMCALFFMLDNFAAAHATVCNVFYRRYSQKWGFYVIPDFMIEVGKF